jgi:hypothetical protein
MSNKSLDASGGSVFLNLRGAAKEALIRAAASTLPFGCLNIDDHEDGNNATAA